MSEKTALITGITGQDGSYLAELLLEKGYTVYGLVRRVSQPSLGRSLINHLMGNKNFHLLNGDLADQNSIDNAVHQVKPDEFYNLGAMSFVPESWRSPMMTADITGLGALRCLEAIRKHSPDCRFYQAGSSEQYGKVRDVPQSEETPNKTIISQNDTFIHEDFPSNENLLIEQGDTVPMGNYFVSWSQQSEEGHFVNYHLDFFEENDGKLEAAFELKPRIQLNERMGNVAEPSTQHFALKDIYTHVTYADLRTAEELGNDEWKNQFEIEFNLNESHYLYGKYQVTLDTLLVDAPDKGGELEYAVLGAGITVKTMNDSTYKVMPVYVVEGDEVQHMDTEIKELGIKFSFDRINYETNRPVIIASEHKEEDVPFILVKAVIFPWINLLWIGSILMALGTVIAVVQRLKRS